MARRAGHVTGVDAAESLLELARERAASEGVGNVDFRNVRTLAGLDRARFDLVYSWIVFQHVPVHDGEAYLRILLALTAPGGSALLHFTLSRPGGRMKRLLRRLRGRSRLVHRLVTILRGERDLPYMQMNEYDETRIGVALADAGFEPPQIVPTDHGGIAGALFISRRRLDA
jgi:ubiquinone/menaquinone biosynthesis C-methylase UbiE